MTPKFKRGTALAPGLVQEKSFKLTNTIFGAIKFRSYVRLMVSQLRSRQFKSLQKRHYSLIGDKASFKIIQKKEQDQGETQVECDDELNEEEDEDEDEDNDSDTKGNDPIKMLQKQGTSSGQSKNANSYWRRKSQHYFSNGILRCI